MFDRLSIRHKLVVLLGLSAALALFISSIITIYSTYVSESQASLRVLRQLSDVISENMRAALAFNDSESADKILAPLHTDSHILLAVVSDESGNLLGEYRSNHLSGNNEQMFKQLLKSRIKEYSNVLQREDGFAQRIESEYMGVLRPVFFEGKPIGSLALISDTQLLWAKIRDFVLVQMATSILTLIVLLFVSLKLQSLFTRPIINLLDTMQAVAATKNYRAVLQSERQDEFKNLYDGFNTMLSEIHERDDQLSKLATTDALTGLANRRHAMESMQNMVIRAQRKGEAMGVIMIDIDHFKAVNDCYGHPVGDLVLQEVSRVIQSCAREYDLTARWGGEEFVVLCDDVTLEGTVAIAERIRRGVESHHIAYRAEEFLSVTVSLGIAAAVPQNDKQGEQLIKSADDALYRAKQLGRNRYIVV